MGEGGSGPSGGRERPIITEKGLARHIGDFPVRAHIVSGIGSHNQRERVANGTLVENNPLNYDGQQRFSIEPINGSCANLYSGRTIFCFYRKVKGRPTGTLLFFDYVDSSQS